VYGDDREDQEDHGAAAHNWTASDPMRQIWQKISEWKGMVDSRFFEYG